MYVGGERKKKGHEKKKVSSRVAPNKSSQAITDWLFIGRHFPSQSFIHACNFFFITIYNGLRWNYSPDWRPWIAYLFASCLAWQRQKKSKWWPPRKSIKNNNMHDFPFMDQTLSERRTAFRSAIRRSSFVRERKAKKTRFTPSKAVKTIRRGKRTTIYTQKSFSI